MSYASWRSSTIDATTHCCAAATSLHHRARGIMEERQERAMHPRTFARSGAPSKNPASGTASSAWPASASASRATVSITGEGTTLMAPKRNPSQLEDHGPGRPTWSNARGAEGRRSHRVATPVVAWPFSSSSASCRDLSRGTSRNGGSADLPGTLLTLGVAATYWARAQHKCREQRSEDENATTHD